MVRSRSAECHSPLVLVVVVVAAVRVACGSHRAAARLVLRRTALTHQLLMLAESVLTGVVTTAVDAQNLPTLLSLAHGKVWVPGLVVFSIPIPPWCALRPSEPGISIFNWG